MTTFATATSTSTEALARIRALLPSLPAGASLDELLPSTPATEGAALWRRSALASTLLAGLELCRDGTAKLDQDAAFGGIIVRSGDTEGRPAAREATA